MRKISAIMLLLFVFGAGLISAQDYKTGIGLRGGLIGGLTFKQFVSEGKALEIIVSTGWGWRGYQVTGLYEIHKAAFTKDDAKGFFWYYGGGAHFGSGYKYKEWHATGTWTGYWDTYNYSTFGVDGIFGLEYKIDEIPVTLSIDLKPFIEFSNYRGYPFRFWDSALSIRYVF